MPLSTMQRAVRAVDDGDEVYVGGFGFAQPFAASHELIRQGRSDLHVVRSSGGFSSTSSSAPGACRGRRSPTAGTASARHPPARSGGQSKTACWTRSTWRNTGWVRWHCACSPAPGRLPFVPADPVESTGQFDHRQSDEKFTKLSYEGEDHYVCPPLAPDVSIVHVARADERGNAQLTGARADIKHGAMAADRLVVTAEVIVPSSEIQRAPEHTIVPVVLVYHVLEVPGGAHPSGVHGRYSQDVDYLEHYGKETATREGFEAFLDNWVYGPADRWDYLETARMQGFAGGLT